MRLTGRCAKHDHSWSVRNGGMTVRPRAESIQTKALFQIPAISRAGSDIPLCTSGTPFEALQLCHNDSMLADNENNNRAKSMPLFVADVFHLAGEFRQLGNKIAGRVGQTQARWQVLSVISDGTWTVAQVARRLGYARQSVQRTSDQLMHEKLAAYRHNPDHAKSSIIEITSQGKLALARITREAEKWHLKLSAGLEERDLATAARVVRYLCATLENE
jgi:DNA-binding MarR family transcriptional regulator